MGLTPPAAFSSSHAFLLSAQCRDGFWYDWKTLAGVANQWPSGYVAASLIGAVNSKSALQRAAGALVAAQKEDGGWGFNDAVPTDADSTANVVSFLIAVGANAAVITRGLTRLAEHQEPSGGIATYAEPGPIRTYMGLAPDSSIEGWCRSHASVTAAGGIAFAAAGGRWAVHAARAWSHVRELQADDGLWYSYWWTLPHYPTAQAVYLGIAVGDSRVQTTLERAAQALVRGQETTGAWCVDGRPSAFATALALEALLEARGLCDEAHRAREWLQGHRLPDGSWTSTQALRIPPPHEIEPRSVRRWRGGGLGTGVIIADENRLFTTATCVLALSRAATLDPTYSALSYG